MNTKNTDPAEPMTVTDLGTNPKRYMRDGQPDWDAIDFEIHCFRCDYNLRTLTRPQCPECGLEFDWHIVLDEATWRSDFLFEHHWSTKPIRSWWTTVWRSFRPSRFWSHVSIHERVHAAPLWFMLGTSIVLLFVVLHGAALCGWLILDQIYDRLPPVAGGFGSTPTLASIIGILEEIATTPLEMGPDYIYFPIFAATFLLAMLAVLCSLRQTLGRRRVRSVQVLRTVAYMSPPALILSALYIIGVALLIELFHFDPGDVTVYFPVGVMLTTSIIPTIYVGTGLKRYLQLPRAYLIALTISIIAILFMPALSIFVSLLVRGWG